ncbi:unnamed protein product [Adineta steineri]|uniref:ADP ribosyltransferase domain-containing protein n=1 Tax=Adineta steineri TaxID=433720 RepID=A0A814Y016_9BILA|nr:unnamed protein product [Adineta steineri]CAF0771920.1 unnamed protein product [Adineta steineri]CAF1222517.1 unnamed protein product [Adineta steineri]
MTSKHEIIVRDDANEHYHTENECHDGNQCSAFQRLIHNGYRPDDIEHCSKHFHAGRRGGTTTTENFGSKKFITAYQNWGNDLPKGTGLWNGIVKDGDLLQELRQNDLINEMDVKSGPYKSLNDVAEEKLNHPRHREMGSPLSHDQMLAILLYTDSKVYKDLRYHEMCYSNQDFANIETSSLMQKNWPILGCLLNSAIWALDQYDKRPRPAVVYHGLYDIEVDPSTFNNHNLSKKFSTKDSPVFRYGTFISTSWDREVATTFMHEKGSLLEINLKEDDNDRALVGADVSWISKFPTECEFLIARGATFVIESISLDQQDHYQVVKVKHGPISHDRVKFRRLYN